MFKIVFAVLLIVLLALLVAVVLYTSYSKRTPHNVQEVYVQEKPLTNQDFAGIEPKILESLERVYQDSSQYLEPHNWDGLEIHSPSQQLSIEPLKKQTDAEVYSAVIKQADEVQVNVTIEHIATDASVPLVMSQHLRTSRVPTDIVFEATSAYDLLAYFERHDGWVIGVQGRTIVSVRSHVDTLDTHALLADIFLALRAQSERV